MFLIPAMIVGVFVNLDFHFELCKSIDFQAPENRCIVPEYMCKIGQDQECKDKLSAVHKDKE